MHEISNRPTSTPPAVKHGERSGLRELVAGAAMMAVVAGCVSPEPGEPPILDRPVHVDEPVDPAAACSARRWIAVLEPGVAACPRLQTENRELAELLADWTVEPLLIGRRSAPEMQSAAAGKAGTRPDELVEFERGGSFCLYEKGAGAEPGEGELAALEELGLAALGGDCRVVVPLAGRHLPDGLLAGTWGDLQDAFYDHAGRGDLPPVAGATPVRLALLDTLADHEPGSTPPASADLFSASDHGFTLANMAEDLVCDAATGGCVAEVGSRLALPEFWGRKGSTVPGGLPRADLPNYRVFVDDWRRSDWGGLFGTHLDLAQAVAAEVDAWRAETVDRPLILNLSLGWEPGHGGLEPAVGDMPAGVQSVYRALEYASCAGALPIVAAGNRLGGPGPEDGPMLPAAWESRPAPTAAECAAKFGLPGPASAVAGAYRPLVYAAGAVRADDRPLANARPGGEPRLVAYGDHALVEVEPDPASPGSPRVSATLTGSSVSALVVSGAAAAVWYYRPDLPPWEVVDRVYDEGRDLGRQPDVFLDGSASGASGPAFSVRRVSVASAAHAACLENGTAACGAAPQAAVAALHRIPVAHVPGGRLVPPSAPVLDRGDFHRVRVDECGLEVFHYLRSEDLDDPCPDLQRQGVRARAAVGPQPDSNPCPNCGGGYSDLVLFVEIEEAFFDAVQSPHDLLLSKPTLRLTAPNGRREAFRLPESLLQRGEMRSLVLRGIGSADESMTLSVVVTDPGAPSEPPRSILIPMLSFEHQP